MKPLKLLTTLVLLTVIPAQAEDTLFDQLGKTHWIGKGSGENIVYIVEDPDCFACWRHYSYISEKLRSDHTTIRWIPVSMLRPERSESKVQAALESNDIDALIIGNFLEDYYGSDVVVAHRPVPGIQLSKLASPKPPQCRLTGHQGFY